MPSRRGGAAGTRRRNDDAATRAGHELVTTGIYRYLRHPSYTGWFWWSVGTQLVLGNPLCFVAYACASYSFFADRIPFEEETLRDFYPREYPAYAARTFVLIPFLRAR